MARCPICNGEGVKLGVLGNLIHFVCRQCGMQFSKKNTRKRQW